LRKLYCDDCKRELTEIDLCVTLGVNYHFGAINNGRTPAVIFPTEQFEVCSTCASKYMPEPIYRNMLDNVARAKKSRENQQQQPNRVSGFSVFGSDFRGDVF